MLGTRESILSLESGIHLNQLHGIRNPRAGICVQLFKRWIALSIHWINHYPLDNSIGFASVYPLDSDLSAGQRNPSFEQLGPGIQ